MKVEQLKEFCSNNSALKKLCSPWSRGEYTYATNGHILVRVKRLDEIAENPASPDADNMFADNTKHPWQWMDVPEPVWTVEKCECCQGTGKHCVAPAEIACEERDEIGIDCRDCVGGEIKKGTVTIDGPQGKVAFDSKYIAMLRNLPGVKIGVLGNQCSPIPAIPSPFTFDGGDGLLMPMRL